MLKRFNSEFSVQTFKVILLYNYSEKCKIYLALVSQCMYCAKLKG